MHILITSPILFVASYLVGSIPFGLVLVKLITGKDIRNVESGRTGGTNAARAAGLWVGVGTALLDGLKAACTVWLARLLVPGNPWMEILSPTIAIIGHNYSIFLAERTHEGRIHLRGGAGGAPCVGGSAGLWFPSLGFILPFALLILFLGGYASVTTLSVAFISTLLFAYRAWIGISPWQYAMYGLVAEILLILALRPNLRRLLQGNERLVGLRAMRRKRTE
jgi:glycerol-3-phosphate acyltransferase PlsY